ncbi:MAG: SUMF1/EgtB/PvdO family nonheme iron enzyme [Alphaproteobacteria bacterium]|nr:SUMF1/EgtB/PvdO family nonheme iron enzyme [Alphaproteobacteria bacterium]MCB9795665.1 SUMF1/EgtB/PvdO family nonheme iron enzyme [Alphaproteobacteria bacterium]
MSSPFEARIREVAAFHGLEPELTRALLDAVRDEMGSITHATFAYPDTLTPPDFPTSASVDESLPAAPRLHPAPRGRLGRYEVLGRIGAGGMGEVLRVLDPNLNRVMALKVLHGHVSVKSEDLRRFVDEAQITAQLRHPSVVPVHELGELDDGRYYFTMEEIRGRTMSEVIRDVHRASEDGPWRPTEDGWSLRRLIEALRRVGEGVAYAHSRGVLHRDLKPSNVLLGEFGEVSVLDWGLALLIGTRQDIATSAIPGVGPSSTVTDARVAGTPSYMSPEQARGEVHALSPASDIFSLGAMLFKILTGHAPFRGEDASAVVSKVVAGLREPFSRTDQVALSAEDPYIPEELRRICDHAMHPDASRRYPDARRFVEDLAAWLEGLRRKDQAQELVARADQLLPEVRHLRARAKELRAEAAALLDEVRLADPVQRKRPAWDKQDEADSLEVEARVRLVQVIRIYQAALSYDPDQSDANDRLAELYRERHVAAERIRNPVAAASWEALLRSHDRGRHREYLEGFGRLTLHTDPPGARVMAYRYVTRERRLQAEPVGELGVTPLLDARLPIGSYLLVLRAPGRAELRYPVRIEREGHWCCIPPGQSTPQPVRLPRADSLGPDDVFIPAGWFTAGGDAGAAGSLARQEVWLDDFVIRRHPVTHAEYLAFLNDLVDQGRGEEADRHLPRFEALPLYGQDKAGHYQLRDDFLALKLLPDMPVLMATFPMARAMARWEAERSGLPWTLPGDLEWEKAARGVDGRRLPWGDFLDPTWCNMRDSHPYRPFPAPVSAFPVDESPYGVRGLAGNIMDWCRDAYRVVGPAVLNGRVVEEPEPPADAHRVVRGGHWYGVGQIAYAAHRLRLDPGFSGYLLGFRLARPAEL